VNTYQKYIDRAANGAYGEIRTSRSAAYQSTAGHAEFVQPPAVRNSLLSLLESSLSLLKVAIIEPERSSIRCGGSMTKGSSVSRLMHAAAIYLLPSRKSERANA
jgi:hypothetical protein